MNKITLTVACVCMTIVKGEPPSSGYGTPLGAPVSDYGGNLQGGDHGNHGHDYNGEAKSYEFGYQVKDDYTGTDYNRKETSDGNQVRGEYRVALPDGRTQIVTYWADWQSGFHADVRYEGEAQYPQQYNKGGYGNGGYGEGYSNGGYSNGVSSEYGAPGFGGGYTGSASSVAINNLASGQGDYNYNSGNSYNSGYNSKSRPSTEYGAI